MKLGNILITGANGFVGRYLAAFLENQGFSVRYAMRAGTLANDKAKNCFMIPAVDGNTDWAEAFPGCEAVIHLAARVHVMNDQSEDPLAEFRKVNVDGTLRLASQAAAAGVKRFIFISSVKVNGEHTEAGKPFTERCLPNPEDAYGQSKHEAEQGLLLLAQRTDMEVVIIRPPLIYGPGVKANFESMLAYIKKGIPLPLGAIHNQRSFVYLGNLVSFIQCCIEHPAAANQVFLVSDGHDLSTTELLRSCAEALGVKPRLLPLPQWLIESCARLLGKQAVAQRLCGNLQVDISKARNMLGWKPPFCVEDGLKQTADGFKNKN